MKTFFLLVVFVFIAQITIAQKLFKAPEYDLIQKEIQDSTSLFYYPKLMARLKASDTTLSPIEYRFLYYGYIYQPNYQPYWNSPEEEELIKYYRSPKIKAKDYAEIIRLISKSIDAFPFDLRQMNFLTYVLHLKGDSVESVKISKKFSGIVDAILSTGDGLTCETSFHVINVSHEYVLLNLFQFRVENQALTGDCDYMKLVKDDRNVEGMYFNVRKLFDKNMELLKLK